METNLIKLHRIADSIAPDARLEERDAALSRLNLGAGHIVCDVPAWGGYMARGITNSTRVVCLDPDPRIVDCPGATIVGSGQIHHAARSASMDRLVSLVGLHHNPDQQRFVNESFRVLKPGGVAVLSEVERTSSIAAFLNHEVDRYAERGHKGIFPRVGDLAVLMTAAGFTSVVEETIDLKWRFATATHLVSYVKHLFAMVKATDAQVQAAIEGYFSITTEDGKVCLPWPLLYGTGVKS